MSSGPPNLDYPDRKTVMTDMIFVGGSSLEDCGLPRSWSWSAPHPYSQRARSLWVWSLAGCAVRPTFGRIGITMWIFGTVIVGLYGLRRAAAGPSFSRVSKSGLSLVG